MVNSEIVNEIDIIHKEANDALRDKKFELYIEFFGDDLAYTQLNGKTINKTELVENTKRYFDRIINFSSDYERKDFKIEQGKVIERLIQNATVRIRVFIFFAKNWIVQREGIYQWEKINNIWKIVNVEIVNEKVF